MVSWAELESVEPDFAARVRARFDAHTHKVLATLRKDGSPRISGIEASFVGDDLWLGMMPGSRKAADVRRDPRVALHSGSADPADGGAGWPGDAKVSGRAVEVDDPAVWAALGAPDGGGHLFRVDLTEATVVRLGEPADHLVIEHWRAGHGLTRSRR
ncbi:MAG TPA: pyridoxamine 5'-phosphate oxidase family protein [Jiangellales bacterium]|nr:pyridoxamine 5'-phosphate oxidase family protein [Jiangellales bacterium]